MYFINSILLVTIHELSDVTVKTKNNYNNKTTLNVDGFNNRTVKNNYLNSDEDLVETTKAIKSKKAKVIKDNVNNINNNAPAHVPRIGRSSHGHKRNKSNFTIPKERPGKPLFPTVIGTYGNILQGNNLSVEHSTEIVKPEDTKFVQSHLVCVILFALVLIVSIGSLIYVKRRR